jgi:hypothetical protein
MKRKNGPAVNLKSFLERSAAKKRAQKQNQNPSTRESQLQLVIYQARSEPEIENEIDCGDGNGITSILSDAENNDILNVESVSDDEDSNHGTYDIVHDPGLRPSILDYDAKDQDSVRREYIALGPCQPKMKINDFPQHNCGGMRRFLPKWFNEFRWIEYSVTKDAAFCFVCYLFKDNTHGRGGDAFVTEGFRNWNMKVRAYTILNPLEFTKLELDVLRDDSGWQEFLGKVSSFCEKYKVRVVDMNGKYKPIQR